MLGLERVDAGEYIKLLKECQGTGDTEMDHSNADGIICSLLEELGYKDVVEEYDKVDKWFA